MRYTKTVLIALLLCICLSFTSSYYWSWAGLASNQTVSWDNANNAVTNGYFAARGVAGTGSKQITKSEALTYYWINPRNATLWDKANSQLVVKQDITAGDVLNASGTLYFSSQAGHTTYGWANPCAVGTTGSATVYYQSPLAVSSKLYGSASYGLFLSDPPLNTDWFNLNGTPVKLDTYASYPEMYRYVTTIGYCVSGGITNNTGRTIFVTFATGAPCSDVLYFTGSYTRAADGLTYTWYLNYNVISGNTVQATQTAISDLTGVALVSGDAITQINGGATITEYICSSNAQIVLSNPLP
ncbi:MAG: hypothetical protein HYU71_06405 [Bacteroidetes bacterium]|nr:hypothetical protein [Bacteroidota bacterium]